MTHELYLDIETIPTSDEGVIDRLMGSAKAPSNYKDPEKIAAYVEGQKQTRIDHTGLEGTWGEVVVVGYAVGGGKPQVEVRRPGEGEKPYLIRVANVLQQKLDGDMLPFVIGHNVMFDMRFLWQRAVINKVHLGFQLPVGRPPYSMEYFDTMQEWAGYRENISLGDLCFALGIKHDDSFSGSDVAAAWANG